MIKARVVEEDDCLVVAFLDTDTGNTIELQYGEPDDQDVALGLTGVCAVVNGGAATAYQAVAHWSIGDDELTVVLTEEAATALEMDPVVVLDLRDLPDRIEVEAALRRVLGHRPSLTRCSWLVARRGASVASPPLGARSGCRTTPSLGG